ncbi:DUF6409 family protein [Streptomyces sp. NPDC005900]|uniref:DUF6409 family protein n=1 Tax=Streptomyces sp. NPDC005900 TaxID=3154569 RepID=UPI0034042C26
MRTTTQPPAVTDCQPGTLVQLTTSAARWTRTRFRTAIVLGPHREYLLIWLWNEGEPQLTDTVRAVLPHEVTPARTALHHLPEGAYWTLREQYEATQDAGRAQGAEDHQRHAARLLDALAPAFEAADLARYGRN